MSLVHGYNRGSNVGLSPTVQQDLLQQQLLAMATGQQLVAQNFASAAANMFAGSSNPYGDYASSRSDNAGSHRESYVDRNRHHRDEGRSHRDKPYRRSPQRSHRSRSPRPRSRGRHQDDRSNYHRWGKRWNLNWSTAALAKILNKFITCTSLENCLYFIFLRCTYNVSDFSQKKISLGVYTRFNISKERLESIHVQPCRRRRHDDEKLDVYSRPSTNPFCFWDLSTLVIISGNKLIVRMRYLWADFLKWASKQNSKRKS